MNNRARISHNRGGDASSYVSSSNRLRSTIHPTKSVQATLLRANSHIIGNLAQGLLLVNDPMLVFNATGRGDALLAPLSGVRERALGEELVGTVLRIGGAGVSVLRSPAPD